MAKFPNGAFRQNNYLVPSFKCYDCMHLSQKGSFAVSIMLIQTVGGSDPRNGMASADA
jgi:hypothetical protein